jgi:hypothetical protein
MTPSRRGAGHEGAEVIMRAMSARHSWLPVPDGLG